MRSRNNNTNKRDPMYMLPQQKWLLFFNPCLFFTKIISSRFSFSVMPYIKRWISWHSRHRHFLKPYCHIRQDQQNVIKFPPLFCTYYASCLIKWPLNHINNKNISIFHCLLAKVHNC